MISLLLHVEKFDSEWPSIQHREFAALDTFRIADHQPSYKISEGIIDVLAENIDPFKIRVLNDFKDLVSWGKT
ncbi:hypothetical protein [Pedobacter panaciterrae]